MHRHNDPSPNPNPEPKHPAHEHETKHAHEAEVKHAHSAHTPPVHHPVHSAHEPAKAPEPVKAAPAKLDTKAAVDGLHHKCQGNASVEGSAHDLLSGLADLLEQQGVDPWELARQLRQDAPRLTKAVFENTPSAGLLPGHTGEQTYTEPQGGSFQGSEKQKRGKP